MASRDDVSRSSAVVPGAIRFLTLSGLLDAAKVSPLRATSHPQVVARRAVGLPMSMSDATEMVEDRVAAQDQQCDLSGDYREGD